MYHYAIREGPGHSHRQQAQNLVKICLVFFFELLIYSFIDSVYRTMKTIEQSKLQKKENTYTKTYTSTKLCYVSGQTDRLTYSSQYFAPLPEEGG